MKRAPNTTLLLLENPEDGTATIRYALMMRVMKNDVLD
jgi:hypothetical protein